MMSDTEWASKMANNFKRVRQEKSQRDALFLEEQRIKQSQIGEIWNKIKEAFNKAVNDFNREMREEIITVEPSDDPDKFTVRRNELPTVRLEVKCNLNSQEIKLIFSRTEVIDLLLAVDKGTGKTHLILSDGSPKESDEVAEWSIEKLLSSGL